MVFEASTLELVRGRFADESSEVLFKGRLSYSETGDAEHLGRAVGEYFTSAPESLRRDCPELFALMDKALERGFIPPALRAPRELAFFRGLGASPEAFTDIYNCYFDSGIIDLGPDEVFVDGGAQDLFTSFRFSKKTRGRYKAIYAFEPEAGNFAECRGNSELFDERMELSNLALSDSRQTLTFKGSGESFRPDDDGDVEVQTTTLDYSLRGAAPTFIKLHLEGAELAALRGARDVIRTYRPKIAVSVDHRPGDIVEIPAMLLSLDATYRLYLRHYSTTLAGTVLYAI